MIFEYWSCGHCGEMNSIYTSDVLLALEDSDYYQSEEICNKCNKSNQVSAYISVEVEENI